MSDTPSLQPANVSGRAAERLQQDNIVWLTTVSADGTPHPRPVWFIWDGDSVLIYNQADALRLKHIHRNPHVSLSFNSTPGGGDIVILNGEAAEAPEAPVVPDNPAYVAKYGEWIKGSFQDPANFGRLYPTPLRVRITKVRGG